MTTSLETMAPYTNNVDGRLFNVTFKYLSGTLALKLWKTQLSHP